MNELSAQQLFHPKYPSLKLFLTPNGKSLNWYAGFHHGGKNVRKSMRTQDLQAALVRAEEWYLEQRHSIAKGSFVPPSGAKFGSLVAETLAYQATRRRSKEYIRTTKILLRKGGYLDRYFGTRAVDQIDSRAWDCFRLWLAETREAEGKQPHAEKSVHQMKNAVRLVLKVARIRGLISSSPRFEDSYRDDRKDSRPRTRFTPNEWLEVMGACQENIRFHQERGTRWIDDARELYDFVRFMKATGLRVGECRALRVRDVRVVQDQVLRNGRPVAAEVCKIRIVGGKRGANPECVSDEAAAWMYRSITERRGIEVPETCDEPLFRKHHRDMFRRLLKERGLDVDGYGRRRDFVSLRHSYISEKLENGVPISEVARNTRTSVTMIEQHYARGLPIASRRINQSNVGDWRTLYQSRRPASPRRKT